MESPNCLCSCLCKRKQRHVQHRQCVLLDRHRRRQDTAELNRIELLEPLNSPVQFKRLKKKKKMPRPSRPPIRRRVNRPQRRRWFRFIQWPRFNCNMKVCGILVVPVLGILALLAVWVYGMYLSSYTCQI